MIIAGAKGFAKELLEVVYRTIKDDNILFFDNISEDLPNKLYNRFDIIRDETTLKKIDNSKFCLGVGVPRVRVLLTNLFKRNGKELCTIISNKATIGSFDTQIGIGCTIMDQVIITNDIKIGQGTLINLNSTVGHDTVIGNFCDISPNVNISGRCNIGNFCSIGTNAVIIPDITIGNNCIIGAGSVITKNIPDNSVVVGVPGKIIKIINE